MFAASRVSHFLLLLVLSAVCSPLTTPEEAQAFLATMRDKSHQRFSFHNPPPSNLSADGMDAWYHKQKQREQELRQRRLEAEQLLRGYRGGAGDYRRLSGISHASLSVRTHGRDVFSPTGALIDSTPMSTVSQLSEALDDPRAFKHANALHENKDGVLRNVSSEDEKKVDESLESQQRRQLHPTLEEDPEKPVTIWRDFISPHPDAKFPAQAGRYHLYLSYACPGSHRVLIVRSLKGLEDAVSVTFVHPTWRLTNPEDANDKHRGWVFGDPNGSPFPNTIGRGGPFPPQFPGNDPDPLFGSYSIRNIYERAEDTSGKYTIPLLWDTELNTIVNNESSDIAYMLNSCMNEFAKEPELDLYTEFDEEGVAKLNEVSEWMAPLMIHGVYRCGFAKSQRAYNKAIAELCEAFDRADDILQNQRYLTGDTLTDVDIRLFVTLIRFDEVYAFYFRANARLVMLTPSLLNFCRELYQIPGVAETCDMEQIKAHFYGSHAEWNKYSVIPRGLGFLELLDLPHNRDELLPLPPISATPGSLHIGSIHEAEELDEAEV